MVGSGRSHNRPEPFRMRSSSNGFEVLNLPTRCTVCEELDSRMETVKDLFIYLESHPMMSWIDKVEVLRSVREIITSIIDTSRPAVVIKQN